MSVANVFFVGGAGPGEGHAGPGEGHTICPLQVHKKTSFVARLQPHIRAHTHTHTYK